MRLHLKQTYNQLVLFSIKIVIAFDRCVYYRGSNGYEWAGREGAAGRAVPAYVSTRLVLELDAGG